MFRMNDWPRPHGENGQTVTLHGYLNSLVSFNNIFRMYRVTALLFISLLAIAGLGGPATADVIENFGGAELPTTFEYVNSYRYSSNFYSDPACVRMYASSSYARPVMTYVAADGNGKDGGVGTISFWHKRRSSSNLSNFAVEYSKAGGAWTQLGPVIKSVSDYAQWTWDLNEYGNDIRVRIRLTDATERVGIYLDDFSLTDHIAPAWTADARLSTSALDFGAIAADGTLTQTISIYNTGAPTTENLVINPEGLSFSGPDAARFTVTGFAGATLAPDEGTNLTIQYVPGDDGLAHSATAVLDCNDLDPPLLTLDGANYHDVANLAEARATAIDQHVRITATVTATVATNALTAGNNQLFVQDASGVDGQTGLLIHDPDFSLAQNWARGDRLSNLTGRIEMVDGMHCLVPLAVADSQGAGDTPAARELNGNENFEAIEGELITVPGAFFEGTGAWQANTHYPFGVPQGWAVGGIFVAENSALAGEALPDFIAPKHVTGLAVRVGESSSVLPRDRADIVTGTASGPQIRVYNAEGNEVLDIDMGEREIYLGRKAGHLLIENCGDAPLAWDGSGVAFTGTDASAFSLEPSTATLSVFWPETVTTMTLCMNPDTTGTLAALLTLTTNAEEDPVWEINLSGEGVEPGLMSWAQYGGGPEHRGRQYFDATVTRLDAPLWQTDPQGLMASATPCVIEEPSSDIPVRVYCWAADATGYSATQAFVKCFNGDTGALLWTSDPINDIGTSIGYDSWHSMAADKASGRVFLGMGSHVFCFDATSGAMLWTSDPLRADSGDGVVVNATCTVGSNHVYQTTYTGFGGTNYTQAFRIADGKEAWFNADGGQGQETVIYHEDGQRAYIYRMRVNGSYPDGGTGMSCLDAQTGEVIWTNAAPLDGSDAWWTADANFGGIAFNDGLIYAPSYDFSGISDFMCVDAYTGALKWKNENSVASDAMPVVIGDRVYITGHYDWFSGPSYVIGFNIHTGVKDYEAAVSPGNNMWNACVAATNDRIYVTEGSSIYTANAFGLHILDPQTGADLATTNSLTQRMRGSVAIGCDGSVYALADTEPSSGLAHLICYRAPVAGTLAIHDQDAPTTDGYSIHNEVTVVHGAQWASQMRVWQEGETPGEWIEYSASSPLTLSAGDGQKTVWTEYRNGSGDSRPTSATLWIGSPKASLSQSAMNFLEGTEFAVDVEQGGVATTMAMTLTNIGIAPLVFQGGSTWTGFAIEGSDDFTIDSITPDPSEPLAAAQTITIGVRFAPNESSRTLGLSGQLVITTNDPDQPEITVILTGDAVPVELSSFTIE